MVEHLNVDQRVRLVIGDLIISQIVQEAKIQELQARLAEATQKSEGDEPK